MNIIYQKSDGMVMSQQWPPHSLEVEYRNVANRPTSTGNVDDYAHIELDAIPEGQWPIAVVRGVVQFESTEDPQRTQLRQSGRAKLKALGLTEEEIDALR